ncbi:Ferroxidase laccase [Rhizoctonia solani]|uniref:Ferroxidase laccase n=1 Tax=Rhizoctonia solani TaxID=456999 RepID=A0A8H7M1X6_9AGAM|nr:Ferroxidase laccase [Rhizoctonia solani]
MIFSRRTLLGVFSLFHLAFAEHSAAHAYGSSGSDRVRVQSRLEQLTLSPDFKITDKPTTRTYDWTITMQEGAPDGFYRQMIVVNGQYPGPTIEANEGDTIIVNVKNKIPKMGTSVHWHGIFQQGTQWMDGPAGITQCPIPSGGSFTYKFRLRVSTGLIGGILVQSAHAGAQLSDGVHGALIIHSVRDPLKRGKHYDYDQVIIQGDWLHNTSAEIVAALDTPQGYQGSQAAPPPVTAMFNGYGTFNCEKFGTPETCFTREPYELQVYPNKKYRLRLINTASHAMMFTSVDEHTLDVIEADDTPVSSPGLKDLHRVRFHNGQRYSVLLNTNQGKPGDAFWMRANVSTACLAYTTPEFEQVNKGIIRYIDQGHGYKPTKHLPTTKDWKDELDDTCRDLNTADLVPIVRDDPPAHVSQHGIFNTQVGSLVAQQGNVTRFFVNNVTFEHLWYRPVLYDVVEGRGVNRTNVASLEFNKPTGADIIINNRDVNPPIDHPYHLHGMEFWIVGEGTGELTEEGYKNLKLNTTNPIRRDTHVIQANSWSVLRIKADNPGVWFLHCHIDMHLAHGFAAVVVVQKDAVEKFKIPKESRELCKAIPPGLNVNSTSLGRRGLAFQKLPYA